MKNDQIFVLLTPSEMSEITGGGGDRTLLGDLVYYVGIGAKYVYNLF